MIFPLDPTPEEVSVWFVEAMTEMTTFRDRINNLLWAKMLGITVPKEHYTITEEEK